MIQRSGLTNERHIREKQVRVLRKKQGRIKYIWGTAVIVLLCCLEMRGAAMAKEDGLSSSSDRQVLMDYQEYQERLKGIERQNEIASSGFEVIEEQIFPMETECFGEVYLVPAMERQYHRLVLFLTKEDGTVMYRTDQLAANSWNVGMLEQPIVEIGAVSFQDLNLDGRMDIVLIVSCRNKAGSYAKEYQVGDVLFQNDEGFYRDYRISDKINRFGMNKSAESIIAHVRDGYSTEFLYTASTKAELLRNGFVIAKEQDYFRQFEKLGYLEVMPGSYTMAEFSTFMIYLVDEQGNIVWSFQPMGDYDNLYALKGIACKDIDGDGMKDLLVFARYSYVGSLEDVVIESDYEIYYQRTSGFETDTEVKGKVRCHEEDTVAELVERARAYWGWSPEL